MGRTFLLPTNATALDDHCFPGRDVERTIRKARDPPVSAKSVDERLAEGECTEGAGLAEGGLKSMALNGETDVALSKSRKIALQHFNGEGDRARSPSVPREQRSAGAGSSYLEGCM
jgi:hypothetical protein